VKAWTRVTIGASAISIGVGTLVLAGWAFDIPWLTRIVGPIRMKGNMAVALVACGLALLLIPGRSASARRIGTVLAAFAGMLGALTLSEHVLGWNLGIDQLLFSEPPGALATASPSRMGPNASMSLTLVSLALLSLRRRTQPAGTRAMICALLVATLAMTAITGYIYGAQQLYSVSQYTGIALPTAITFLTLSIGVLAATRDTSPVSILASQRPGGILARRLVLSIIALPLTLGYVRILGQRANLYDTGLGAALFAITLIAIFGAMVWRTAIQLDDTDRAREAAQHTAAETEDRFRALANEAPVLIWVEDQGRRVWFNKAWAEFTGIRTGTEFRWQDWVHPEEHRLYADVHDRAAKGMRAYSTEFRLKRADGGFAWVIETATPRRLADGTVAGYVGSCVDISDRKAHERERDALLASERAAKHVAERANRLKDEFLAVLSHELRTPLNTMLGWTQILSAGSISDDRRQQATEVMARNGQHLARLVEDLLDVSRITSGQLPLTIEPVPLVDVVQAAIEEIRLAAGEKGIGWTTRFDGPPAIVSGDRERLRQIVANLLSNAIKFTPAGGSIDVRTRAIPGDAVELTVNDTGIGIAPEFLPHVFDRFRQGDATSTREHGGLGLGLSIVRELTALHGGRVEAYSGGPGKGATFVVTLPVTVTAPA
jgi:PAS domain S-box-containing protein